MGLRSAAADLPKTTVCRSTFKSGFAFPFPEPDFLAVGEEDIRDAELAGIVLCLVGLFLGAHGEALGLDDGQGAAVPLPEFPNKWLELAADSGYNQYCVGCCARSKGASVIRSQFCVRGPYITTWEEQQTGLCPQQAQNAGFITNHKVGKC